MKDIESRNILSAYRKWVSEWIAWETGHTSFFTEKPRCLPLSVKNAMMDEWRIPLCGEEISFEKAKSKKEVVLKLLVREYFREHFALPSLVAEGKLDNDIAEILYNVGNAYLQSISDFALDEGIRSSTIYKITGHMPNNQRHQIVFCPKCGHPKVKGRQCPWCNKQKNDKV